MNSRWCWAAALAAAGICGACARAGAGLDRGDRVAEAEAGAARAAHCAVELQELVDEDPAEAARLLEVAPIRIAPHGGAARARSALREEIVERLGAARANASAARTLAAVAADAPQAAELSRERAARSLAASGGLCRAAAALDDGRYASRR
jgi:hypothetical protein